MIKKISRHLPHYASLIGIFTVAVVALSIFDYDRQFQIAVSVATAVGYITWGIVHHYVHKDLYLVVVLEYISVALLGLVIILSLLFRV